MGPGPLSKFEREVPALTCIGIVAALNAEARTLAKQPITAGELIHLTEDVFIRISGVGPRRAYLASKTLLGKGVTALLSWGVAGALIPRVSSGSLVLPQAIIAADQTIYPVNAAWHARLCKELKGHLDFHTEPVAESTSVLASSEEKAALFRRTGAIAVDMESGAVAAVAHGAGIPFIAIRVIADPATMAIPLSVLTVVDEFGQLRMLKLIRGLAKHPTEVLALVRLSRNFRAARTTLAMVARLAGSKFFVPE